MLLFRFVLFFVTLLINHTLNIIRTPTTGSRRAETKEIREENFSEVYFVDIEKNKHKKR